MKKIISVLLVSVLIISTTFSAFAEIADSDYWMNTTSSLGNFLVDPVYENEENHWVDDGENFIIIYYSSGCYYSQQMLPTFADYAEKNKIKTFAINYNQSRGFIASKLLDKSVLSFPIVVAYNANIDRLFALDEVYTEDKFNSFIDDSLNATSPHITLKIGSYRMTCDNYTYSLPTPATIINGRTMVPMRAIFEAFGAKVKWYDYSKTARAILGATTIDLTINSNKMYVNGNYINLDVAPQLINNNTMVPVRAISEAFGRPITWDSNTQTVEIK